MKRFILLLTFASLFIPTTLLAGPLQVGTAVTDITPPIGYRMSGYFHERLSTGVKDPLLAKAIVFAQDETVAALVICDIVGISLEASNESRRLITEQLGIPASHVSIAATHSHTGPLYFGSLRNQFHEVTVARESSDPREKVDYPDYLVKQIVAAVQQAHEGLQPVQASAGYGFENRIAFNRRFIMKDGSVRTWVGPKHPDALRVAGPIDPEIGLIQFNTQKENKPFSALTVYALHLDTLGGDKFSADFPFFLQEELSKQYGKDFLSVFGAGTCGDINHVNYGKGKRNKTDEIGKLLAESVQKALPQLEPISNPKLAVKNAFVNAEKQKYSAEEIAQAKENMAHVGDRKVPFPERVKTNSITAIQLYEGDTIPFEVHAFQLSPDVAIVTLPGEVFVRLGMQIKLDSPYKTTIVIELANDAPGYIPTRTAFSQGSYETINSRVVPGSGEAMAKTAVELLKELHATN